MRKQNITRAFWFIVFFSVGAASLCGSILCGDLLRYYTNQQLLETAEVSLSRLKALNADYDALLQQLREDPNLVKRIAPATLGTEPAEANTIYPKATAEQLAAVRKALMEVSTRKVAEPEMPDWLTRCCEPRRRVILFLAGAFLVLVSFIWFGRVKEADQKDVTAGI
jgi:hypothetical protein